MDERQLADIKELCLKKKKKETIRKSLENKVNQKERKHQGEGREEEKQDIH